MTFEIYDGISYVDITPYIALGGLKWSRNDVDGPNAGRMMNAEMQRDRIATKIRWDVTCRPLTSDEQSTILQLIQPEFVQVKCLDPITNTVAEDWYYSNNFPSTFLIRYPNGTEYWNGLTFPLIMK